MNGGGRVDVDDDGILEAFRRSNLFADLSDPALAGILRTAQEVTLPADGILMTEGDEPDAMYVILEGLLEVSKREGDSDVLLATCGPGEPIGELSLVSGRPRSSTVRAKRDSHLLRIPAESFGELLCQPSTALVLLQTVVRRLETQEVQLRQQAKMAALGKLSAGLLHEANNPAAAVRRGVDRLRTLLDDLSRAIADIGEDAPPLLDRLMPEVESRVDALEPLDSLVRSDRAGELESWLSGLGATDGWALADPLVELGFDEASLDKLLDDLPDGRRLAALRWIAAYGEALQVLDEADLGAARVSETVGAVKAYVHTDEAPVQHVRVTDGIEHALVLLRHKLPPGVRIARDYDDDLPAVEAYPGELNSVWTNLIDNALDAVGGSGTITLRGAAAGRGVRIEVVDDGSGIPPDKIDKIFDPFFTTKPVGKGTGLGLSTSYGIVVNQHQGTITAHSVPGETRFVVELPLRLDR